MRALAISETEVGSDTITAYADSDRSGTKDGSEPGATAAVDWTPRTTPPATINVDGGDLLPDTDGCGRGPGTAANPCNTIQKGIAVAEPGDTVDVATSPRTDVEEVTVDKAGIELVGPQDGTAGFDPHRTRPWTPRRS
jgi:hypothetical protein